MVSGGWYVRGFWLRFFLWFFEIYINIFCCDIMFFNYKKNFFKKLFKSNFRLVILIVVFCSLLVIFVIVFNILLILF